MQKKRGVSIKDIAQKAGVSTSLVSFVLNGKQQQYHINEQVAERVIAIAKEYNYKPNGFAKSLRDGRSKTIGVIVSDISNQFFANIVRQIEIAAEEKGYMSLFASSDEKAEKTASLVEKMMAKEVDGIILVPCEGSEDTIHYLQSQEIPFVLVDRTIPECKANYVCLNNVEAGYQGTKHLLDQGYKKIAMVAYNTYLSHMKGRIQGYRQAMDDAGMHDCIKVRYADPSDMDRSCGKLISNLLEEGVDAMLFATNTIVVHCLYHIKSMNVRIPEDLGLAGFDNDAAFDFFHAPLTYIQQPVDLISKKAVDILLDNIEGNKGMCQQVETPGNLVVRASSSRKK